MRDPITYTVGELVLTVALIYVAGFLSGQQHADRRHRRNQQRRAAARRRYDHRDPFTPQHPQLFPTNNKTRKEKNQ